MKLLYNSAKRKQVLYFPLSLECIPEMNASSSNKHTHIRKHTISLQACKCKCTQIYSFTVSFYLGRLSKASSLKSKHYLIGKGWLVFLWFVTLLRSAFEIIFA